MHEQLSWLFSLSSLKQRMLHGNFLRTHAYCHVVSSSFCRSVPGLSFNRLIFGNALWSESAFQWQQHYLPDPSNWRKRLVVFCLPSSSAVFFALILVLVLFSLLTFFIFISLDFSFFTSSSCYQHTERLEARSGTSPTPLFSNSGHVRAISALGSRELRNMYATPEQEKSMAHPSSKQIWNQGFVNRGFQTVVRDCQFSRGQNEVQKR